MDYIYTGTHSIRFKVNNATYDTWNDWHLIPTSRPFVAPPPVKTQYVEIPGADGQLDYTDLLSGIKFNNRTGTWQFLVMNGFQEWYQLYNRILYSLHGRKAQVILTDEPDYYYIGRISVDEWGTNSDYSTITFGYNLEPYKKPIDSITSGEDWLWNDLFDLVIYYGTFDIDSDGIRNRNLVNPGQEEIEVALTCTSPLTVRNINTGTEYIFSAGVHLESGIMLSPGGNIFQFIGSGRVTIDYSKGAKL